MVYRTQTEIRAIESERKHRAKMHSDPRWWEDACTLTVQDQKKHCYVAVETWKPRPRSPKCDSLDDNMRAFDLMKDKFEKRFL